MKQYVKDGQIRYLDQITITKDGLTTYNPSEEMVLADGWTEYVPPVIPEPTPEEKEKAYWEHADYNEEVNKKIREKYSESEEFALLRQRDTKSAEFDTYNAYCEECKKYVKEMLAKYPRPVEEEITDEQAQ